MDLSGYGFKDRYKRRTGFDLLREFYIPALERSSTYDRVAGYFSSAVLTEASSGFARFCSTENSRYPTPKFRLIVGARLNEEDEHTILHLEDPETQISESLLKKIDQMRNEDDYDFSKDRISGLAWMIDKGLLEIKVGIRFDPKSGRIHQHNEAEFHSKLGIMSDGENKISFEGSVNETKRGWVVNYESLVVFRSWMNEEHRVGHHQEDFDELWDSHGLNSDLGVGIYSFPDAARKQLLEKFPPRKPESNEIDWAKKRREYLNRASKLGRKWKKKKEEDRPSIPGPKLSPSPDQRWSHQVHAKKWFLDKDHANGAGIFQMATGSGKTRTSISTVKEAISKGFVNKAIFCVPKTLEKQWATELSEHYPERKGTFWWRAGQDEHLTFFNLDIKGSVMIVSHYFIPDLVEYANKKRRDIRNTMIVVDEMHHLGSDKYSEIGLDDSESKVRFLPNMFEPFYMRLGLSATPWSEYDDGRNQMIIDNFVSKKIKISDIGDDWEDYLKKEKLVFYFGLENGIKKGILCEFDYVPLDYTPSAKDFQKRKEAFKKIPPNVPKHMKSKMGMILAAQVFKSSREKFPPFNTWLKGKGNLERCILFVSDKDFGRDLTVQLAKNHSIFEFREFFQGEDMHTLKKFANGGLDLLIACHRISEGVDIKTVDTVVLFSSNASKLETIQRIGRALRISPDNPEKKALIVDFIYSDGDESADVLRKNWLIKLSKSRRE